MLDSADNTVICQALRKLAYFVENKDPSVLRVAANRIEQQAQEVQEVMGLALEAKEVLDNLQEKLPATLDGEPMPIEEQVRIYHECEEAKREAYLAAQKAHGGTQ